MRLLVADAVVKGTTASSAGRVGPEDGVAVRGDRAGADPGDASIRCAILVTTR